MKKITIVFLFFACFSFLLAAQAAVPEWCSVKGVKDKTGFYAVGSSKLSNAVAAEKSARTNARENLADITSVVIKYIVNDAEGFNSDALTKQIISASRQVDYFMADGTTWILVFQPYDSAVKNIKAAAAKQSDKKIKKLLKTLTVKKFIEALEKSDVLK